MMQHTKIRRLYLREPSALIPTVTKNISIKASTLSIFQKNITLISKLLKKTLQICKNVFKFVLNSIKTKLSLGVPVNNIYRELREGIGNRNSRETSSGVISKRHLLKKAYELW